MVWQPIQVSSKILGHISAGVYRSPAGAIKELVSNAFDADATRVAITTNWPSFDIITCRDNGTGMTLKKFEQMMQGGIGDSSKRIIASEGKIIDRTPKFNRPIIGWLGIGMLGVAQICHEFKVISHHEETQTAFQAVIRLIDFLREKTVEFDPKRAPEYAIDVGQFSVEEIDYDSEKVGTYVIASEMRSAFRRKFREKSGNDPLPSRISIFLDKIRQERSAKEFSDYWQMVWELTIACPIPYLDDEPFNWKQIDVTDELKEQVIERIRVLKDYQFEVVVDGLSLRKPNFYPYPTTRRNSLEPMKGKLFPIKANEKIEARPLRFSGYLYLQDGQAIDPLDLAGVLVRIRNVAIGGYDLTYFKYPKIQTFIFNWLSGEIYVEEGLEYALNIDRDSFNEMHPHFVKLQQIIHNLLDEAIQVARQDQGKRSQVKQETQEFEREESLNRFVSKKLDGYTIVNTDKIKTPVTIDTERNKVLINPESPLLPKLKIKQDLVKQIMLAFEMSMLAPEEQRRDKFYELLLDLVDFELL